MVVCFYVLRKSMSLALVSRPPVSTVVLFSSVTKLLHAFLHYYFYGSKAVLVSREEELKF